MLTPTQGNPLLSPEQNAYLAAVRLSHPANPDEMSYLAYISAKNQMHDSHVTAYLAHLAAPQTATSVEWRLTLRTILTITAALTVIWSLGSTLELAFHAPLLALQDIPLLGMNLAMAYTTIQFSARLPLASLALTGAIVAALVI